MFERLQQDMLDDDRELMWRVVRHAVEAGRLSAEVLDAILGRYVEEQKSSDEIIAEGFDEQMVRRVARLVLINEYKRRQAPPGVRITHRAFGRDRRYPITSGWRNL